MTRGAAIGMPALYLKPGTDFIGRPPHSGKEQILFFDAHPLPPTERPARFRLEFRGMVDDARYGFLALLEVANAERLPTWTPGDEFEAPRKAALAR